MRKKKEIKKEMATPKIIVESSLFHLHINHDEKQRKTKNDKNYEKKLFPTQINTKKPNSTLACQVKPSFLHLIVGTSEMLSLPPT